MIKNIILSLFLSGTIFAQSFSLIQHQLLQTGALGTEIIFNFSLINTGTTPLNFYVKRTMNNIPEEWQSSLCFSSCFAPFIDSIVNNETFGSAPLPPGDTADVSVHVFTMIAPGQAHLALRFGNIDNPLDTLTRYAYAATSATGITSESAADDYLIIANYPNPFNPETNVIFSLNESGYTDLRIISPNGVVYSILTNQYFSSGTHQLKIDFDRLGLASGIYYIQLQSGIFSATRKAVFLK
jgi:hypothetical protein